MKSAEKEKDYPEELSGIELFKHLSAAGGQEAGQSDSCEGKRRTHDAEVDIRTEPKLPENKV